MCLVTLKDGVFAVTNNNITNMIKILEIKYR